LRSCLKIEPNFRAFERSGVAFSLVSFFWRSKRKKLAIGEMLFKTGTLMPKEKPTPNGNWKKTTLCRQRKIPASAANHCKIKQIQQSPKQKPVSASTDHRQLLENAMLRIFNLHQQRLQRLELQQLEDITQAIWLDLQEPDKAERQFITDRFGQELAQRPELNDIEASARFFEDKDGLHIHSLFFYQEELASTTTVAFTIRDGRLFTLRERELPVFRLYRMRARNNLLSVGNAYELLLDLFEVKIEQLADTIEEISLALEVISQVILKGKQNEAFKTSLLRLTQLEDMSWKVRLCLMDTQRAIGFLLRKARLPVDQLEQARDVLRDVESLLPHNESFSQRVNFLLQSAMGFINIEQNRIIKIFSVVSVIFLPPTLVASSYGMNFQLMPELTWQFGYPMAIGLMLLAGLAPYLFFKRKGWL
jgi:magnesium transporter